MKKELVYICSECGNEFLKWSGKCDVCGSWNSLKEIKADLSLMSNKKIEAAKSYRFSEINSEKVSRIKTGFSEFDRVLGGGIVAGSVLLIGGDPGIGKSTLALQVAVKLKNVCYITGEESLSQISLRYRRIGGNKAEDQNQIIVETDLEAIEKTILKIKPDLMIFDSIQTMYLNNYPSAPGSLVQVRESALKIIRLSKSQNIASIIIGHMTKDGDIAGPRVLEHMVDVVLYLEGERYHDLRILRGLKNRFGDATEIGIFQMDSKGLKEMPNPSAELLAERLGGPGSVVTATIEGTRPFLVEVQALINQSLYGYPKRTASGFDLRRLDLLLAVLKKNKINLNSHDVYVNVVGGMKLNEPAVDLGVVIALISVFKNFSLNKNLCVFGEIGLSGEIRKVKFQEKRENEAKRLGYEILPKIKSLDEIIKFLFKE